MRRFMILAVWLMLAARPALADVDLDTISRTLSAQGFTRMEVSTTLLGRLRVVATSDAYTREIVFNANTGEILRDYWRTRSGSPDGSNASILDPGVAADRGVQRRDKPDRSSSSGSTSRDTSDREDRDDRSDDDRDDSDDRSGREPEREDHDSSDREDDD